MRITSIVQDLKYAARTLRRQPGFSITVALTLALGLGINATVIGMMDALLLRPFQFQDYQRLVVLWAVPIRTGERQNVSPADYLDWRKQARSVERLVAWEGWNATLTGRSEPERVQTFRVSPEFFDVLGIRPQAGRSFVSDEEEPGNDRSVVIGDGLWKRRFGGDSGVIGTRILLDGEPYSVVGIAPHGFDFPVGAEMWAPLAFSAERAFDRTNRTLTVLGKLSPGKTLADAQVELDTIAGRLERDHPATNRERGVSVRTLSTAFREDGSGGFMLILQLGAMLVLLIACANLAGLLLARANDRERELALRTALGAGRMRIARQVMTETVLLGLVASTVALLIARVGLDVLRASIPAEIALHIEGWNNVRLDRRLLVAIPVLAIGLGALVGLIPAIAAVRKSLTDALKDGDRGIAGGVRRQRVRQGLVVAELAFAVALLVAAGLAAGGGMRLVNQPGGFQPQGLLTFDIPVPENRYADADLRRELANSLVATLRAIPGVQDVALANVLPAAGWSPSAPFVTEEDPIPEPSLHPRAGFRAVSAGYFEAMHIPITRGRSFSTLDRENTQPVAIVSASLSELFWPGRDPVGRRLRIGPAGSDWVTIVGVAGDVTMYNWWDGIDFSAVYVPLRQAPPAASLSAIVRTQQEPRATTGAARAAVASVDPQLAIHGIRTMEQAIVDSTFGLKFLASLMGICGGIALVLSAIGVYSMMSYAISQRMHEFGVRMALGATAGDVRGLALKQAGVVTAAGVALGLVSALLLGRMMSSMLAGIISMDPALFVGTAVALAIVSFGAAYMPARRSSRLDPATILRGQ